MREYVLFSSTGIQIIHVQKWDIVGTTRLVALDFKPYRVVLSGQICRDF